MSLLYFSGNRKNILNLTNWQSFFIQEVLHCERNTKIVVVVSMLCIHRKNKGTKNFNTFSNPQTKAYDFFCIQRHVNEVELS